MNYDTLSFDEVKAIISRIFARATLNKWSLVPDDIHKLAESAVVKLGRNKLSRQDNKWKAKFFIVHLIGWKNV